MKLNKLQGKPDQLLRMIWLGWYTRKKVISLLDFSSGYFMIAYYVCVSKNQMSCLCNLFLGSTWKTFFKTPQK